MSKEIKDYQAKAEKAFRLLIDIISSHPDIELVPWVMAMNACVAHMYVESDASFEVFSRDMTAFLRSNKSLFKEKS
jgi:hypothetical protein